MFCEVITNRTGNLSLVVVYEVRFSPILGVGPGRVSHDLGENIDACVKFAKSQNGLLIYTCEREHRITVFSQGVQ